MAVVLWGYLEELILYHLGAYACFDLKTRMPWLQMVGAGVCVLLACVSDIPSSITSYGVMLCVVFFALKEEWKRRFWHVGVLFVLISGMGEIVERLATTSRSRINSHACFRFKIFCTSVAAASCFSMLRRDFLISRASLAFRRSRLYSSSVYTPT